MQYWLLYTAIWIGVIIIANLDLNENYSPVMLGIGAIAAGYVTALVMYNLEDQIKYLFRKAFSGERKLGLSSRIKKPKFRLKMIPDLSASGR